MQDDAVDRRTVLRGIGGATLVSLPALASGQSGPYFAVDVEHTPDVLDEGETSVIEGTITNTGDGSDTQLIDLTVTRDGQVVEEREGVISLDPGESFTRSDTIDYAEYPGPGEYVGEVCSDDECATETWTVVGPDGPAFFEVEITDTTEPAAGEPLTVTADVRNLGGDPDSQTVSLTVDGLGDDATTVDLAPDETTSVTLSVATGDGDAGTYTATVESDDNSDESDVAVLEPATFAVDVTGTNSPVREGESLAVDVRIENTGEAEGTQSISLDVPGVGLAVSTLSLPGATSTPTTLSVDTETGDAGTYTATVESDDDSDSTGVVIQEPASVTVDVTDTNSPVAEGETLSVDALVENTSTESTSQSIELSVDGQVRDVTGVTLDPNTSQAVTLEWTTTEGDAGEYVAVVASNEDVAEVAVTVTDQRSVLTYANDEDVVDTPGLRDAIDDWQTGVIDTALLRDVIDAWQSGDPVDTGT